MVVIPVLGTVPEAHIKDVTTTDLHLALPDLLTHSFHGYLHRVVPIGTIATVHVQFRGARGGQKTLVLNLGPLSRDTGKGLIAILPSMNTSP